MVGVIFISIIQAFLKLQPVKFNPFSRFYSMEKTAAIKNTQSCFYYQAVQNDVFHLFTLGIEAKQNYYFVL